MIQDRLLYLIALPIILVLVIGEYIYRHNSKSIQNSDLTVIASNLFLGLLDRLFFLFFGIIQYEAMKALQEFSLFSPIKNLVISSVLLFLIVDVLWYWYHRIIHNIPLLWTFHCTHHQTNDYSLTLGFRLSFIMQVLRSLFWIPIVLLGFKPIHILTIIFFQNFYQFFIHTDMWSYPKWVRKILVTPKSHKLHHSNSKDNINANFGGVLIIWDFLFRTYRYPYNRNISLESDLSSIKYIHPINGLLLPLSNFMNSNQMKRLLETVQLSKEDLHKSRLFKLFIVFFIPCIILIYFSSNISFVWLSVISLTLLIIILSSLYSLFRAKME